MTGSRGYVAAAVGAIAGATLLAVLGAVLGIVYAERFVEPGLEQLGPYLVGLLAGAWVGGGAGIWAALRVRRHRGAGLTAALGLVFVPIAAVGGFLLSHLGPARETISAPVQVVVDAAPVALSIAAAVIGARAIVLKIRTA